MQIKAMYRRFEVWRKNSHVYDDALDHGELSMWRQKHLDVSMLSIKAWFKIHRGRKAIP